MSLERQDIVTGPHESMTFGGTGLSTVVEHPQPTQVDYEQHDPAAGFWLGPRNPTNTVPPVEAPVPGRTNDP